MAMSALSQSLEMMTVLRVSCEDCRCFPPISFQRPEISLVSICCKFTSRREVPGHRFCVPSNTGLVPGTILAFGSNSIARKPRFGCYSQVLNLVYSYLLGPTDALVSVQVPASSILSAWTGIVYLGHLLPLDVIETSSASTINSIYTCLPRTTFMVFFLRFSASRLHDLSSSRVTTSCLSASFPRSRRSMQLYGTSQDASNGARESKCYEYAVSDVDEAAGEGTGTGEGYEEMETGCTGSSESERPCLES
jgi:hypothetical protein